MGKQAHSIVKLFLLSTPNIPSWVYNWLNFQTRSTQLHRRRYANIGWLSVLHYFPSFIVFHFILVFLVFHGLCRILYSAYYSDNTPIALNIMHPGQTVGTFLVSGHVFHTALSIMLQLQGSVNSPLRQKLLYSSPHTSEDGAFWSFILRFKHQMLMHLPIFCGTNSHIIILTFRKFPSSSNILLLYMTRNLFISFHCIIWGTHIHLPFCKCYTLTRMLM
jgi:hypothetical protein